MLSRVVSAGDSSRIPTLSIAWTSTIETDAVVTAVGGIKATIIAISSLLLIGVVIICYGAEYAVAYIPRIFVAPSGRLQNR